MGSTLESAGLFLRPLSNDDPPAVFEAVRESLAELGRWLWWCHPQYALRDAQAFVATCQDNWRFRLDRDFGVFSSDGRRLLGCVGINEIDDTHNFGNLGYWVRTSEKGRGVASIAAGLVARFGFETLKLSRIEIVADVANIPSRRVAEKIGAQFEGVARNRLQLHGRPCDAAVYSVIPQ